MAYVPSSEVPSAFLISSDADAVLLDFLGTFVLLDGGTEKVLFTKHVRQIDANIISAPTKAALTNAVELNKETVVPLVGNIPVVKKAGKADSVAGLLKHIELASEGRPAITPTRFDPKYEPIVISKSLRTGRLEMYVLSGNAKEIEALRMAVESCDEQSIEKAAAHNGTISVLVWFPAKSSDPIKRILHTGTAPFGRIVSALEKAKALPFLHSPCVSAANAFKEVGPPSRTVSSRAAFPSRGALPTSMNNAIKPPPTRRSLASAPPSRAASSTTTAQSNATNKSVKPLPAAVSSTRARVVAPLPSAAKPASPTTKNAPANKRTMNRDSLNNKNVGISVRGTTTSHQAPALNSAAAPIIANHKPVESVEARPSSPTPLFTVNEGNEAVSSTKHTDEVLGDSVHMLDDVVPEISVDAPQDPVSQHRRASVELVVIPPTPEPVSLSSRSSIDGNYSPGAVQQHADSKEVIDGQPVLVRVDGDRENNSDISSTITSSDSNYRPNGNSAEKPCDLMSSSSTTQQLNDDEVEYSQPKESLLQNSSPFVHLSEQTSTFKPPISASMAETTLKHEHDDVSKVDQGLQPTTDLSDLPDACNSSDLPVVTTCTVAEPFIPPSLTSQRQEVHRDDVPEEFKGPHIPQEPGTNGLLDDLEDPPKLRKISMDTDNVDDTKAGESNSEIESQDYNEAARKLSQQMISDACSPFASALASSLVDGAENKKAVESAHENLITQADTHLCDVAEEDKSGIQMMTMQTRSNIMENDANDQAVKYNETDPIIDSLLETVARDSDRIDHVLRDDRSGLQAEENGNVLMHHVDEEDFRVATDSHQMRLYLPPLSTARSGRAPPIPHLSRPLFFELATVPHINGKCALTDDQSAIEYFSNIRSTNYILHSEDVSPLVLEGWLVGKKHWLNNALKSRLIPTRHHSALQAFVTANAAQMEECGLVMNSSLEHNTISLNTEDGREDYHMIKIEL